MKRKAPENSNSHKQIAKASAKPAPKKVASSSSSSHPQQKKNAKQQRFAAPLPPLDQDSEEEEEDEEAAAYDAKHLNEIDDDNEQDEDAEEDEDEDEDDEEESAEAEEEEDEEMQDEEEDGEEEPAEAESAVAEQPAEEDTPLELDLPFQLVQGTYSGLLYGLKSKDSLRKVRNFHIKLHSKKGIEETDAQLDDEDVDEDDDEDTEMETKEKSAPSTSNGASPSSSASSFALLFTTSAHIGSIKALAISPDGKWMVSGGVDETIKIFKTSVMREFGQLHQHVGSITALEFYGSSFLLSGGQEGDLIIWNTKSWQLAKRFEKAHQGSAGSVGGVSCLAVHPSGKVALSVGALDKKCKLWDLMKGSMASTRTLDFSCHVVRWAPNGLKYALLGDKRFEIYDTNNTLLRREEVSETKLLSAVFLSDELIAIGCEDKTIRIHLVESGESVGTLQGHLQRVRGLDAHSVPSSEDENASMFHFLASASTDGQTHLWDVTPLVDSFQQKRKSNPTVPAMHPCCSSFHDQRATILRILPQWKARKDLQASLQTEAIAASTPKVTKDAAKPQKQTQQQQQQQQQQKNKGPSTKAEKEARQQEKSKLLFEKSQRNHAQKELAKLKAQRILAKNNPAFETDESSEATGQQPKKKQKKDFEEAPVIESDDDMAPPANKAFDEDDDEEDQKPASKPAAQKSKPVHPPAQAASQTQKQKQQQQPQKKQQPQQQHQKKSAPVAVSDDDEDDGPASKGKHSGFQSGLPLFKPNFNAMEKKKKKSDKKIQRDAERSRQLKARS